MTGAVAVGVGTKQQEQLNAAREKLAQATLALEGATSDAQRARLGEKRDRAQAKVQKLEAAVRKEQRLARYREAEARLASARADLEQAELEGFASDDVRDHFEGVLVDAVRELINLRRTGNILSRRAKELTDRVRTFVARSPTGWVAGQTDPERRYLCWVSPDGTLQVVLEDNPLYEMSVDAVVQLVGFAASVEFLKVDYPALHRAVEAGRLVHANGTSGGGRVAVEELDALRTRRERAKSVEVTERGPGRVEELVEAVAPELVEEFVETLEPLGLDGGTLHALHTAGITRIGHLRCLSGMDLAQIKGIGPVRAGRIISAIVRHVA